MNFHVYSLRNIDYLEKILKELKGKVYLTIGDNHPLTLTGNPEAINILRCMQIASDQVLLQISDPDDRDSIVKYLIGS